MVNQPPNETNKRRNPLHNHTTLRQLLKECLFRHLCNFTCKIRLLLLLLVVLLLLLLIMTILLIPTRSHITSIPM